MRHAPQVSGIETNKQILMIKKISVIGAGTMGNGIAHVFAMKGFEVSLIDVSAAALDKALATISKNLDRMVSKNSITQEDKESALKKIVTNASVQNGIAGSELVIEAATENAEL